MWTLTIINKNARIDIGVFRKAFDAILNHEATKGNELFEKTASKMGSSNMVGGGKKPKKNLKPAFTSEKRKEVGDDWDKNFGSLKNYSGDANLIYGVLNFGGVFKTTINAGRPPMKFRRGYISGTSANKPFSPSAGKAGTGAWVTTRSFTRKQAPRKFDEAVVKRRSQYVARHSITKIRNAAKRMWIGEGP